MAHELDFTTGRAAFIQAGERVDAWHKHGTAISRDELDRLSTHDMIERVMREGQLNWTVDPFDITDETGQSLPGWKAFKRSDTNALFGVFRETYTIVQNRDLFTLLEPMIDAGMIKFETAGAIKEGTDVWTLFNFNPQDDAVRDYFAEQEIMPYLLIHNNHSRERLLSIQETLVKVVCKNTLSAATGAFGSHKRRAGRYPGAVMLRHTRNVKSLSVDAIDELWGRMTRRYTDVMNSYEALKQRFLSEEEFDTTVLELLAPLPSDIEDPRAERALIRSLERRNLLTTLYQGAGRGIDGEPTAWNAYMAVTEAIDHYRDFFSVRSEEMSALFPGGSLANKKQDALNLLSSLAMHV